MTAPCTHGMPTPAACTECMAEGNMPAPRPKPRADYQVPASFRGPCPACGETILPGQIIGRVDGAWVCARCHR